MGGNRIMWRMLGYSKMGRESAFYRLLKHGCTWKQHFVGKKFNIDLKSDIFNKNNAHTDTFALFFHLNFGANDPSKYEDSVGSVL